MFDEYLARLVQFLADPLLQEFLMCWLTMHYTILEVNIDVVVLWNEG